MKSTVFRRMVAIGLLCSATLLVPAGMKAQSAEKSSGVKSLNMQKPATRGNEESVQVQIRMDPKPVQATPTPQPAAAPSEEIMKGFTWIAPQEDVLRIAENTCPIEVTVNADENIRFVNVFVNDRFARNIIPPVPTIRQMVVKEEVNLNLGINTVRVEVIGVSGKKSDSEKTVIYDFASARYYALVIAVEKYNDPAITDLDKPVEDASRFLKVIQEDYTFDPAHVTFLKNPTKADIIGTLHNLRTVVTPSDNLLIYYAGHGYWDEEMQTGYWLPRDARRDNPVDWLPNTDLTNYLNALKTKHTLLIADACFSGGIFKTRSAFNDVMTVEKLYRLKSRKALTSGNLTEVPDESAFVKYLIQLLEENNKEYLTAEDLYLNLRKPVENNSPNVPKYGVIQNVGDEGGDFVFIRKQE